MEIVEEVTYEKDKSRGDRRKKDWHHAMHKRHISSYYGGEQGYYHDLHTYSKNKVHCSCPICSNKTRGVTVKKTGGPGENWSEKDRKRIESMQESIKEFQEASTRIPET